MICCCVPTLIVRNTTEPKQKYIYLDEGYGRTAEAMDFIIAPAPPPVAMPTEDRYGRTAEAMGYVIATIAQDKLSTEDKYGRTAIALDFVVAQAPDEVDIIVEN